MHRRISRSDRSARESGLPGGAGFAPSKSKGQNFLTQRAIADRIVAAASLCERDVVVEIGPGLGILTGEILAYPIAKLFLVELDRVLGKRMREALEDDSRVEVIEGDFAKLGLNQIAASRCKVIGNLPFNSAAAIFRNLCDCHRLVSSAVLMFQREVADRLRAGCGDPDYSAISVFRALYFDIDLHFRVAAGSFYPRPKVDAEVIRMRPLARTEFRPEQEGAMLEMIRAGFHSPRKTLRNSLAAGLSIIPAEAEKILELAGIDPAARAQSLSVTDFISLAAAKGSFANDARASRSRVT